MVSSLKIHLVVKQQIYIYSDLNQKQIMKYLGTRNLTSTTDNHDEWEGKVIDN